MSTIAAHPADTDAPILDVLAERRYGKAQAPVGAVHDTAC